MTAPLPSVALLRECLGFIGKNVDGIEYFKGEVEAILKANKMEGKFQTFMDELIQPPQPEVLQSVEMDITLNDENKLDRGYLVDNEHPVDDEQVAMLDSGFHGWWKQEGMLCRGQLIYEGDADKGEIKTDAKGEKVQVDPAVLKDKLLDPMRGLKQHFDAHLKGIELETLNVEVAGPALDTDEVPQPE